MVSRPVASVITSISFDHMEYLGDTLEKIAYEKAGIIKSGVPVIYNIEDRKASEVIGRIADEKGCRKYPVHNIDYTIREKSVDRYTFDTRIEETEYRGLSLSMIGDHQTGNAICALTVLEALKKEMEIQLNRDKLYVGFEKAKQTGRFEILQRNPYVIIDGAHNEAGAEALLTVMREHFYHRRILMIVGVMADKKVDKLLERFEKITDDFITTEPDNPRRLSASVLCRQITARGNRCIAMESPEDVCRFVKRVSSSYDAIIFAGSLYLIGKVRGILGHEEE